MDLSSVLDRPDASVVLVVNTGARQGAAALDLAEGMVLERRPASMTSHAVHSGADLVATLDRVMADAPDVLVVGGGDGTVSCAAARVAGTSTVLVV
ncbi:MAG: diacylglycerol kinase, partial [Actinomycetales bacterium]